MGLFDFLSGPPAPPDYMGLAQRQNAANRPDINTPFGGMSWDYTPGQEAVNIPMWGQVQAATPDHWQMNVDLPPQMQAALEAQQRLAAKRSGLAESLLDGAQSSFGAPFDWAGRGQDARQRAEDAIYQRASSRLDPRFQQQENDLRTRMIQQGLTAGDAGWDREMGNFDRGRNDAYDLAQTAAIQGGGAEAQRQFGLDSGYRTQPINEINAMISGQQVGMPQFPGAPPAANLLGAANMGYQGAMNQYGANQAGAQGWMQGLASIAPFMF